DARPVRPRQPTAAPARAPAFAAIEASRLFCLAALSAAYFRPFRLTRPSRPMPAQEPIRRSSRYTVQGGVTVARTISETEAGSGASPRASAPREPAGPIGLPYLGCLDGLLRNPMKFWLRIANRYEAIAKVPIKGKHVYLVSDPE